MFLFHTLYTQVLFKTLIDVDWDRCNVLYKLFMDIPNHNACLSVMRSMIMPNRISITFNILSGYKYA